MIMMPILEHAKQKCTVDDQEAYIRACKNRNAYFNKKNMKNI